MPPQKRVPVQAPQKKPVEIKRSFEKDLEAIEARGLKNVVSAIQNIVEALRTNNSFKELNGFKKITNIHKMRLEIPSNFDLIECKVTDDYRIIFCCNGEIILLRVGNHNDFGW